MGSRIVFNRILQRLREKVRAREYVMTTHAEEEMEADGLEIFDVEHCMLRGEIVERQKDPDTGEWKYLVSGNTVGDEAAIVVTKLSYTGKMVIVTMFLEQKR